MSKSNQSRVYTHLKNDHFDNQIHTKFVFCRKFITLFDAVDLEWFNLTESDDGHCNVDLEMFQ